MSHSYKSLIAAGSLGLILASGSAYAENQGSSKATAPVIKPDSLFGSFGSYFDKLAEYIENAIRNNPELQAKIAEAEAKAKEQKTPATPVVTTPVNKPTSQSPATRFQSPKVSTPTPIVAQRPVVNKPTVTPSPQVRPNTTPAVPTVASTPSTQWTGSWFQSPRRWWQTQLTNQPQV
ncbi:MAG: hypothetical protein AB8B48_14800, partial [Pseudomonadales bacterium]